MVTRRLVVARRVVASPVALPRVLSVIAALVIAITSSMAANVAPATAAETFSGVVISDEGGNQSVATSRLTDNDPGPVVGTYDGFAVRFTSGSYRFTFSRGAGPFELRRYENVMTVLNSTSPGMSVEETNHGCGRGYTASFTLLELPESAPDGTLTTFAADLAWRCKYTPASDTPQQWVHASIRVNASSPPAVVHAPMSIGLPDTTVGESSVVTVEIPNPGTGSVEVGDITVGGPDAVMFAVERDGCSGRPLLGGARCSFDVRFAPSATQDRVGWIAIGATVPLYAHTFVAVGRGVSPLLRLPSALTLNGDVGGWVIDGAVYSHAGAELDDGNHVADPRSATVLYPNGEVAVAAPDPDDLALGRYDVEPFDGAPMAGLSVSAFGHGCNFGTGWFEILEVPEYDVDGTLLSVAFDFEHHCQGAPERIRGSVRFHSALPLVDLVPPSGTVAVNGGADLVTTDQVSLNIPASDVSGVADVSVSNDGISWSTTDYTPTRSWSLADPAFGGYNGDGPKHVYVRWRDNVGNQSVVARSTVTLNTSLPSGTISIAGGAATTRSRSVTLTTAATEAGTGLSQVALSNDGTTWTTRTYAASQSWLLPATNGLRTVHAKWKDTANNWSDVITDTIVLDTVAPTVTEPRRGIVPGTAITSAAITLRVPWSGTDATSGIARYEVGQQTDGGAWTTVSTTLTNPTINRRLATEHTYAFRVRPVDRAGNIGSWVHGATFRLSRFSEHNASVVYTGTWATAKNAIFWGGAAKHASDAGATASLTFTGRSIAWVARTGPNRGLAVVLVNGVKVATVDLYAPAYGNQRLAWVSSWTTSVSRKVTIRVLGTAGRPRVDLDAFVTAN